MLSLTDERFAALQALVPAAPPTTNDMLFAWLLQIGGTGNTISDRWRSMLVSKGITASQFNDMFFTWLGTLGFTGTLNDRQLAFWRAGAPTSPTNLIVDGDFPDLVNWTNLPSSAVGVPIAGTLRLTTLVNGARRGGIAVNPGGAIAVVSGQQYTIEITVSAGPTAIEPITIGMSNVAGDTDRVTFDGPISAPEPYVIQGIWDVTITESVRPVVYTNFGNTLFTFDVQNFLMRSTQ